MTILHAAPTSARVRPAPSPYATPVPWGSEPALRIPEWHDLGLEAFPMKALCRHMLITGEAGSGKTVSGVVPLIRAVLRYDRGGPLAPALLVLDPKRELTPIVAAEAAHAGRHVHLLDCASDADDSVRIDMWEGVDTMRSSPQDLLSTLIVAAGGTAPRAMRSTSPFWELAAAKFVEAVVALDRWLIVKGGLTRRAEFWADIGDVHEAGWLAPAMRLAELVMVQAQRARHGAAWKSLLQEWEAPSQIAGDLLEPMELPLDTAACLQATISSLLAPVFDPLLQAKVHTDPFSVRADTLSLQRVMETGEVLCIAGQPAADSPASLAAGRIAKAVWYRLTFRRATPERPLIYMADEAQNFITGSGDARDASYVDRSRAYRAAVIYATQSVAAIGDALANSSAGTASDQVQILLTNTSTKLLFRGTAPEVRRLLADQVPMPPVNGAPHVMDIRRPTALRDGEAYWLGGPDLADGEGWGVGQCER